MRRVLPTRRLRRAPDWELVRLSLVVLLLFGVWLWLRWRASEPVIAVWDAGSGRLVEMGLEEYIRGVVAAEVPADFHLEALKAQAVAARTYALRRLERNERVPDHPEAHVTSDFRRHQAWMSREAFIEAWGPGEGTRRWARVASAVDSTRGLVLTYRSEPIEALYHSTSGGHTEDAHRYFAGGQPYLVGVPDPWGDHSPVHTSVARFPVAEVLARLGVTDGLTSASGDEPLVSVLSRTPSGRAEAVWVAGSVVTGRRVREALGLRSSWFEVALEGEEVVFHVRGSGHGVGMPQYGADGMARAGFGFADILAYYYPGTELVQRY
ncbi:MAG: stage II sporulation protein D [Firmicutes bacterium ZCTH02-B6]|nr:MAG: stage II sporulation protein D [Firmicutes bacterium ZCTH02-B6]